MSNFIFYIFYISSLIGSLYSIFGPNPLNKLGLSANPVVFTESFFFAEPSLSYLDPVSNNHTSIDAKTLFPNYKPLSISRPRYLVLTRFFKLSKNFNNFYLQSICNEFHLMKKTKIIINYPRQPEYGIYEHDCK